MSGWRRCPHVRIRGIYGDEIRFSRWFRLKCLDCDRLLSGPVNLRTHELFDGCWLPVEGESKP